MSYRKPRLSVVRRLHVFFSGLALAIGVWAVDSSAPRVMAWGALVAGSLFFLDALVGAWNDLRRKP